MLQSLTYKIFLQTETLYCKIFVYTKTVTRKLNFDKVVSLPKQKDFKPLKPSLFWRCLIRIISIPGLLSCRFTYKKIGMEKLNKKEPCRILMNHSCFLDLQIAESVMFPRPLNIVCT